MLISDHVTNTFVELTPGNNQMAQTRFPKRLPCLFVAIFVAAACVLSRPNVSSSAESDVHVEKKIAIEWANGSVQGQIVAADARVLEMKIARGKGALGAENRFTATQDEPFRLELKIVGSEARYGNGAPTVTVAATKNAFSFFLHDVDRQYPIYLPSYGVAVTTAEDTRSYKEIDGAIRARGLLTNLQHIQREPEESYETAAQGTRSLQVETWLGVSRDMRLFIIDKRLETVQPTFAGQTPVTLPETNNQPCRFEMEMGRGWGAVENLSRRLEDGVLPILHGTLVDDDVTYQLTTFATLEKSVLSAHNLRGTHFLVADGHSAGSRLTAKQQAEMNALLPNGNEQG